MRKFIHFLADKPIIFNTLRRIIEANFISIKQVIRKEFSIDNTGARSNSEEKVLDVPCGTGELCTILDPRYYYGLDISDKYIDYARRKYKRRFFCRDARHSGFDNDCFDKILSVALLHHLDDSSVSSVLKELHRILKPDGILLLIEDAPTSSKWNVIGKMLQRLDIGSNIRHHAAYNILLEKDFFIRRYYHITSGFWDYSVFVLSPNK